MKAGAGHYNQSFSYDGWGNLQSKMGGSSFSAYPDPSTNRLSSSTICYDPNGNMVSIANGCSDPEYAYDNSNRLKRVAVTSNGNQDGSGHTDLSREDYYYTADGKRVSTVRPNGNTAEVFYIYGAKNEIAALCTAQLPGGAPSCDAPQPRELKFAGRLIRQNFYPVTVNPAGVCC